MISYSIRRDGQVFNGKRVDGRKQLTKAAWETLRQGLKIVKQRTPVGGTGRLRNGWEIVNQSAALENAVPYAIHVEVGTTEIEGVFYARDSVPEIEALFEKMIIKYSKEAYGAN